MYHWVAVGVILVVLLLPAVFISTILGEGIEYDWWGSAKKCWYQSRPVSE